VGDKKGIKNIINVSGGQVHITKERNIKKGASGGHKSKKKENIIK